MKKSLLSLSIAILSTATFAQDGMRVGSNATPLEVLHVDGAILLGSTTNTNTGAIRWNGSAFQGYDGTTWINLGAQGSTYTAGAGLDITGSVISLTTHTGDVTGTTDLTIAANAVSNTKLADVPTETIKGRIAAGTGDPQDLTVAQTLNLLGLNTATSGTGTANKVAFWTGANTLDDNTNLHWDNTNARLGVGEDAPDYRLHVKGNGTNVGPGSNENVIARFEQSGASTGAGIQLIGNRAQAQASSFIDFKNYSVDISEEYAVSRVSGVSEDAGYQGALAFYTNPGTTTGGVTEKMRITSAGVVRVNALGGSGVKLIQTDNTGNLSVSALSLSGTNTGDITLTGQSYLSLSGQALTASAVNLAGTHVTGVLPVANGGTNSSTALTNNRIMVSSGGKIMENAALAVNSGPIYTDVNGLPTLTVPATGAQGYWTRPSAGKLHSTNLGDNVGIGTNNPVTNLDVANLSSTGHTEIAQFLSPNLAKEKYTYIKLGRERSNGNQADIAFFYKDVSSLKNYLGFSFYGTGIYMAITHGGNVGIGTTEPLTKLHVDGGITMREANNTDNASPALTMYVADDFQYNSKYLSQYGMGFHVPEHISDPGGAGAYMSGYYGVDLFTSGTNRVSIKQGGRVGIGDTDPNSKLQVNGGIGIGTGNGISTTEGARRSIQLNTDNSYYSGCDNHSGILMYSIMPCAWTQAELRVAISTDWGTYNTGAPALRVLQTGIYAYGYNVSSDRRLKSDFKEISYGLVDILKMKPLTYTQYLSELKDGNVIRQDSGKISFGFIAQELYEIIPEIVSKPNDEAQNFWAVDYGKITPVLVKAIQEQQQMIEDLRSENKQITEKLTGYASLRSELDLIKRTIGLSDQSDR